MQRLFHSGHDAYCIVVAAKLLHEERNNMEEIKLILRKATAGGSDGAKYFNLMLKVLAKGGFLPSKVLPTFRGLFNR